MMKKNDLESQKKIIKTVASGVQTSILASMLLLIPDDVMRWQCAVL